jgi:hypothetical protein
MPRHKLGPALTLETAAHHEAAHVVAIGALLAQWPIEPIEINVRAAFLIDSLRTHKPIFRNLDTEPPRRVA